MKIRNGFVSNSSTSSFVILGCRKSVPDDWMYDYDEDIHGFITDDTTNEHIFGELIQHGDFYDWENTEHSIVDFMEMARSIAIKHDVPLDSVKLYTGIRQC